MDIKRSRGGTGNKKGKGPEDLKTHTPGWGQQEIESVLVILCCVTNGPKSW